MIDFFERLLYGNTEYLRHSDLAKLTRRHPFSAFLNYVATIIKKKSMLIRKAPLG
jgi:formate dehydrogenase maturation protein FdhE